MNNIVLRQLRVAGFLMISAAIAAGQGGKKNSAAASAPAAASATPSTSSAPSASGASSSAAIESQVLAINGLNQIANDISTGVCSIAQVTNGSTVVIFDQASFASLQAYESFIANASAIVSLYESLLPDDSGDDKVPDKKKLNALLQQLFTEKIKQVQPRAMGVSNTIDPFSDATSLISAIAIASTAETPGSIVIPDGAMAVALTTKLTSGNCASKKLRIAYPPLFGSGSSSDYSSADIQSDLAILHEVRSYVTSAVSATNNAWIKDHTPTTGAPPTTGDPTLTAALADITGMYDNYMTPYFQMSSSGTSPGSGSVVQGFQLANLLAGPADKNGQHTHPAYVLLATVISAGGTMRDHKSFWTALGNGDKITFSGGVIVSSALWQASTGTPLYTAVLPYRVPFSKMK